MVNSKHPKEELAKRIIEIIDRYGDVTFAELVGIFPEHFNGDQDWMFNDWCNVLIWSNLSVEFCEVMDGLIKDGKICMNVSDFLCYLHDGTVQTIPVATMKGMARGYKATHWLPVNFTLIANKWTFAPKDKVIKKGV